MSKEVIFRIIKGSLKGEEFVFDEEGLCLIGRSADCTLQIPKANDMRVSRRHCLLILNPPRARIRDLGSRNGTTVNNRLIDSTTLSDEPEKMNPVDKVLKDGDVISIGETVFLVEIPSAKSIPIDSPRTKVIKLTKPIPTQTGTLIPKSQPINTGFFKAQAKPSSTITKTVAMTEAISREELSKNQQSYLAQKEAKNIKKNETKTYDGPGSIASGPLTPPAPKPKPTISKPKPTISGPLAPPQPKKSPILLGKKKSPAPTPDNSLENQTEQPKILKAKIVNKSPKSVIKSDSNVDQHGQTVIMSATEINKIPDIQPEESTNKKVKRTTKFKIKGPK